MEYAGRNCDDVVRCLARFRMSHNLGSPCELSRHVPKRKQTQSRTNPTRSQNVQATVIRIGQMSNEWVLRGEKTVPHAVTFDL